jgi:hypothetical protein
MSEAGRQEGLRWRDVKLRCNFKNVFDEMCIPLETSSWKEAYTMKLDFD